MVASGPLTLFAGEDRLWSARSTARNPRRPGSQQAQYYVRSGDNATLHKAVTQPKVAFGSRSLRLRPNLSPPRPLARRVPPAGEGEKPQRLLSSPQSAALRWQRRCLSSSPPCRRGGLCRARAAGYGACRRRSLGECVRRPSRRGLVSAASVEPACAEAEVSGGEAACSGGCTGYGRDSGGLCGRLPRRGRDTCERPGAEARWACEASGPEGRAGSGGRVARWGGGRAERAGAGGWRDLDFALNACYVSSEPEELEAPAEPCCCCPAVPSEPLWERFSSLKIR